MRSDDRLYYIVLCTLFLQQQQMEPEQLDRPRIERTRPYLYSDQMENLEEKITTIIILLLKLVNNTCI